MKTRLILVINPRSSGFAKVHEKIIRHVNELNIPKNNQITYEIEPTSPLENAEKIAKILKSGDVILVAGGDGTAHIATNAIVFSEKENIKIKYAGFGNFNDYAHSFSKNNHKACVDAIQHEKCVAQFKPLKIYVNDKFYRLAPLYMTIGLTAEIAEIFEHPKVRGALKKTPGRNSRLFFSLLAATRFYFKNRKECPMKISSIRLDEEDFTKNPENITDLVFMNGPRMARIMRSRFNKSHPESFGFVALNSGKFIRNIPFLIRGLLGFIPLKRTKNVEIIFKKAKQIHIQIEGETATLEDTISIKVLQSNQIIKVL